MSLLILQNLFMLILLALFLPILDIDAQKSLENIV